MRLTSPKRLLLSLKRFPLTLSKTQYAGVTYKKFEAPKKEEHDHRNMRLKRPMSPHLTIYAPQLTSMTSITHRITGMVLAGYAIAMGGGALVLSYDMTHYADQIEGLGFSSFTLFILKFLLASPFAYHLANGVRHLNWDTARSLTLKEVYSTGYAMLGVSLFLSFLFAALLALKSLLPSLKGFPAALANAQYATIAVTYKKFEAPKQEEHDLRNMRLNRPMSPHLTIYQPQLTTMTSITHRITGMVVSGYAIAMGGGALVLPYDMTHYADLIEGLGLSSVTLFTIKFVLASPFAYHLANGVRHLNWDTGKALTIKEVYSTGYAMLAASVILSAVFAAL